MIVKAQEITLGKFFSENHSALKLVELNGLTFYNFDSLHECKKASINLMASIQTIRNDRSK